MRAVLLCLMLAPFLSAAQYDDDYASDIDYSDVRLGYGIPILRSQADYRPSGGTTSSGPVTWSRTGRTSLTWVPWPSRASEYGSGLIAIELVNQRQTLAADALREALDQRLVMADLHLGMGWIPASAWTIEGTWFGGAGLAWQPGSGSQGSAYEFGVRVAVTRAIGHFLVGASLAGAWQEWRDQAQLNGGDYDLQFRTAALLPGFLIGWRF